MFVDTHAHIYVDDFEKDLDEIIRNALDIGVKQIFMPNIDEASLPKMLDLNKNYNFCFPMLGLHPCHVFDDYKAVIANLWKSMDTHQFYAVGEIGIDLYWDKTFYKEQISAFQWQISLAKEARLPIVIHSREALDLTISTVMEMQDGNLQGIFHCFNGNMDQAHKILDVGFHLGIGGVITYKNAGLDKILADIPLSGIVLETDAPYLSPVPFRGKRNQPAYIHHIGSRLAEVKNLPIDEIARSTSANANKIFFKMI